MHTVNKIAIALVIIGAINWLLVGLFSFDLVASIFASGYGTLSVWSRIIYTLVGLSGLWVLFVTLPALGREPQYGTASSSSM